MSMRSEDLQMEMLRFQFSAWTLCSLVDAYQCFGDILCLSTVLMKMEAVVYQSICFLPDCMV
jgi:hypothetical protein